MHRALIGFTLFGFVLGSGCSSSHTAGMCAEDAFPAAKAGDLAAVEAAAAAAWAERKDVAKLREAIAQWKEAVAIAPKKAENYTRLARAMYFLGDGYLRLDFQEADEAGDDSADAKEEEMVNTLEQAYLVAEKAIRIGNPDYAAAACAKEPLEETISKLDKSDIDAVYWYAVALGKHGLATSLVTVLSNKEKIYLMMRRIEKLDPDFLYGAADRYLAGYFTKVPFPGGDHDQSRKHFEKSIKASPNYLATRVLYAELLATKLKDKALGKKIFDEQLKFVDDTAADVIPEVEAEAILEKKKAKMLRDKFDETFWED